MMVVSFALLCLPFTCALSIDTCVAGAPGCGADSLEADVNVNLLQSAYSMRSGVLGNHDPAGSDGEHKMPDMQDTYDSAGSVGNDTHGGGDGTGGNNDGTMPHPVTCAEHITQPTCDTRDKCHWEVESQMCMMQPNSHDDEPCKDDCPLKCTECEPACTDAAKGGNATQCYECVERTKCQKCLECQNDHDHGHGHDDEACKDDCPLRCTECEPACTDAPKGGNATQCHECVERTGCQKCLACHIKKGADAAEDAQTADDTADEDADVADSEAEVECATDGSECMKDGKCLKIDETKGPWMSEEDYVSCVYTKPVETEGAANYSAAADYGEGDREAAGYDKKEDDKKETEKLQ